MLKRILKKLPPIRRIIQERDNALQEIREYRSHIGFPPGHYYSPIPSIEDIRSRELQVFAEPGRELAGIDLNEKAQHALLNEFTAYYKEIPFGAKSNSALRYYFENSFYSYSDAVFLYSMIRHNRPARIIEIGSGFSSAAILDINELFFDNRIDCVFIEPYPDRLYSLLKKGDEDRLEIIGERLQEVRIERFADLTAGDILLIDSTHVSKIGSDVNHIIFNILPDLKTGVHVHFHDIIYPFEYPKEWVYQGRFWNENYLLRAFLEFNQAYKIELFTNYLHRYHESWIRDNMPLCLQHAGAQIWIQRT